MISEEQIAMERRTAMIMFLSTQCRKALLAGVALSALLMPPCALAAEREGTVLFFAVEDLQQPWSHSSLPLFSQLVPSFAWLEQPEAAEQDGRLERNSRWATVWGAMGIPGRGLAPCGATKRSHLS